MMNKKIKLELDEQQLKLISKSLDFYSRIGIGQFKEVISHPTFEKIIYENHKKNWSEIHNTRDIAEDILHNGFRVLTNSEIPRNGSYGIHNKKVDESCREAYDLHQDIRHYFWTQNENRSPITVDSSVHYTSSNHNKIEIKN